MGIGKKGLSHVKSSALKGKPHGYNYFQEAFRVNEFYLKIDGKESPGIHKVSGLSLGEWGTEERFDGGSNIKFKVCNGIVSFPPLVLERYMGAHPAEDKRFNEWFQEVFKLKGTGESVKSTRKNGIIYKQEEGKTVLLFLFYGAWISSIKYSDLDASTAGFFTQTITLEHLGLEEKILRS
ncbi:MAG: phage tail protein [Planctomycetota bacterium]|nr:MAG: phage tail protein [Planctomycetota bacterium]